MRLPAHLLHFAIMIFVFCGMGDRAHGQSDLAPLEVLISVEDQRMIVLREGGWVKKYKISTSRFGLGDNYGSYKTPLGRLRVSEKLGGALPSGAVLKHREATGEILSANAPGRDPIVSRILWLEGLESQNDNARARGIYIHGTTEEANLGKPVSWGCIRMRSEDVIELYDILHVGAMVTIEERGLPHFAKWKPGAAVMVAAKTAPSRSVPERASAVAELLKPAEERVVRADVGAANAFRGSILFAGLPTAPKPVGKTQPKVVPRPGQGVPLPGEDFRLTAAPQTSDAFSLIASAEPPLGLIDLRRLEVSPLLAFGTILDAPAPQLAGSGESDGETKMSAMRATSGAVLR